MNKQLILIITFFLFTSYSHASKKDRWYTEDQVKHGKDVFEKNCASCHGKNAEATKNWKKTDANGKYPAPPLNGTAHAWHHDLDLLRRTVREGGQKLGGLMPPFENTLTSVEIDQAISYFQSKWSDDIYERWSRRFEQDERKLPSLSDIFEAQNRILTKYLSQRTGIKDITANKTELEGVWQAQVGNQFVYLINNGKHAIIGEMFNLEEGKNLTKPYLNKSNKKGSGE